MDSKFYKKAADYWSTIPATLEGVLGGFGFISETDINASKQFLDELFESRRPPRKRLALDCGAGIGRVSQGVLIDAFEKVDMVEQNPKFLEAARELIKDKNKIGELFPIGLQDFKPSNKYDVIWCQWVLGHLEDNDLIDFFNTCKNSLNKNGVIIVKENVTSSGNLEKDEIDSSMTRPLKHLLNIFKQSNLKIIKECRQTNFPEGIYPVYMFALRPSFKTNDQSKNRNEKHHLNTALLKDRSEKSKENVIERKAEDAIVEQDSFVKHFENLDIKENIDECETDNGSSEKNEIEY